MEEQTQLVEAIIKGIQEKKGSEIVVSDLTSILTAPCKFFVICQGNSPQQVEAITRSVEEMARTQAGEKPAAIVGRTQAQWVAMDYGTVIVHIFLPDVRDYYDLEHLWEDAPVTRIPEVN